MISTKGRYALRIAIDLSQHMNDGPVSLKAIADRQDVSVKYMEAIAGRLSKAGIITAQHGKKGGYVLSRQPVDISVGEILKAAEGDLNPVSCAGTSDGCINSSDCLTYPLWNALDNKILNYLESVSLDDVLTGNV